MEGLVLLQPPCYHAVRIYLKIELAVGKQGIRWREESGPCELCIVTYGGSSTGGSL